MRITKVHIIGLCNGCFMKWRKGIIDRPLNLLDKNNFCPIKTFPFFNHKAEVSIYNIVFYRQYQNVLSINYQPRTYS